MKEKTLKSIGLPILSITLLGILCLAVSYLLYYGFVLFVERFLYADNPSQMPMGIVRITFTVLFALLYLLLLKIKGWHLTKAILMIGPLGVVIVTLILSNYQQTTQALLIVAVVLAIVLTLLRVFKKPWFYYYAAVIATLTGFFYAWPR